ncbi:hypothetical protein [Rodentibacter pneumotropicus]|uniref:Uncharacterized protein n=1 Tax=Rodentibacter pneumotropicus TaxID=758 RepID=A0A4S2PGT3_9PAST|nr:hypothetical protein [Rodentibacter pneumotropicus]MDC2825413.1 hypothetical protein [Rodentibacter pneumotropicus]TGZ98604.1 hypothetical protein D3M79_08605 [Rodentibacter pneumotropicus]THA02578.1 hypothetical protein D3M74_02870 [Rodentibacter pneumotropicus]THA08250.1 hypothetical protein D3M77_05150 [Rodentibacter pneumotropicus]THA17893.1 hypothetical protein D3M76_00680 [Rodentibacter pneumotropicus]
MTRFTSSHITETKIIIRPNKGVDIEAFVNKLVENGYKYLETQNEKDLFFSRVIELADHSQYEIAIRQELEVLVSGQFTELTIEYVDFEGKAIKLS